MTKKRRQAWQIYSEFQTEEVLTLKAFVDNISTIRGTESLMTHAACFIVKALIKRISKFVQITCLNYDHQSTVNSSSKLSKTPKIS